LFSRLPARKPLMPFSRMKALDAIGAAVAGWGGRVRAMITKMSPTVPWVMKVLVPFRRLVRASFLHV